MCLYLAVVVFIHAVLRAPRHALIHLVPEQEAEARHQGVGRLVHRGRGAQLYSLLTWKGEGGKVQFIKSTE